MSKRDAKLESLGYPLDRITPQGKLFDAVAIVDDMLYASGHVPYDGQTLVSKGKVPSQVSMEDDLSRWIDRPLRGYPAGREIPSGQRFVLLLILPAGMFAWGDDGYQITCLIAEERLTFEAKAGIHELLGKDVSISDAEIASWADNIRWQKRSAGSWHYVDIPTTAASFDEAGDRIFLWRIHANARVAYSTENCLTGSGVECRCASVCDGRSGPYGGVVAVR